MVRCNSARKAVADTERDEHGGILEHYMLRRFASRSGRAVLDVVIRTDDPRQASAMLKLLSVR